jgi:hypothetical protein
MPREYKWIFEQNYVKAAIAIVIGVLVVEFFATTIMHYVKRIGAEALLLRNVFLVFGYIVLGLVVAGILGVTGELIKIANTMIFSSAVVFEEEESFEPPRVQVRYEFSVEYEPSIVLEKIRKSLVTVTRDFNVYIEEQSDKNYYIVIIVANVPQGEKVREFRSKILEKLISIHRELALKK